MSTSSPSSTALPPVAAAVKRVLDGLPHEARRDLLRLRTLIHDVHAAIDDGRSLEETLKWGAPSYLRRGGSTVRLGWSPTAPAEYRLYFHCQSSLVPTFRELYSDALRFEGRRAIVFAMGEPLPEDAVRHCVELALRYHKLKHLPLLGC